MRARLSYVGEALVLVAMLLVIIAALSLVDVR